MRRLSLFQSVVVLAGLGYMGTAAAQPTLQVNPATVTFNYQQGGPTPAPQVINVTSLTGSPISFTDSVSSGSSLFAVNVSSGTTPATITVSVIASELPILRGSAGGYIGIVPATGLDLLIQVNLAFTAAPTVTVSPSTLIFNYKIKDPTPPSQTITLTSTASGLTYSLAATTLSGGNWLSVNPQTGTIPGTITASLNSSVLSNLPAGTYQSTINFVPTGASAVNVPVTLNVSGGPEITGLLNNFSYTRPGLPNYGIAPGTLFDIFGTGLANTPNTAEAFPLTTSLNGVSAKVEVNGTTTQPTLYFVTSGQIGAVLSENTPVGNGSITVTNNGLTSAEFPIVVVQSDFGILTTNGAGSGPAAAFDQNYIPLTDTHPAHPGDLVIAFGTGVGPDPGNDDQTLPQHANNLTKVPIKVFIGGAPADIYYRGRNRFPGLDSVIAYVPQNVSPGCGVSFVTQSGNLASNLISNSSTIPVAPKGSDTCSDPLISGNQPPPSGPNTYKFGSLFISQITYPSQEPPVSGIAQGLFLSEPVVSYRASNPPLSLESCKVTPQSGSTTGSGAKGIDAGAITFTSQGQANNLTRGSSPGFYFAQLPASSLTPPTGGTVTFTGAGGTGVGAFTATLNVPPLLTLTNQASVETVDRSQGVTVKWSGGASGTYVTISGSSTGTGSNPPTVSFSCNAPVNAGQFTVPDYVTRTLPPGTGTFTVENTTIPQTFSASGLDYDFVSGANALTENVVYR